MEFLRAATRIRNLILFFFPQRGHTYAGCAAAAPPLLSAVVYYLLSERNAKHSTHIQRESRAAERQRLRRQQKSLETEKTLFD
jgi:hypothetical protein